MDCANFEVGSRIHYDNEYATVQYVGSVEDFEGTWLGVEWDNPSRGKHSGCYEGKTYFTTRIPNAGSFIRISKADLGISCPTAVKLKYGKNSDYKPPTFINLPQKTGQERHIEMVGMEKIMGKQSNFTHLAEVILSKMLISHAGENNELRKLIPNVKYLDLSENLLSSWYTVIAIVEQLSQLTTLILSRNRLKLPDECHTNVNWFTDLKTLVLNEVAYSWNEILQCASLWSYIMELNVENNGISYLKEPSHPDFSNLQALNLNNNPICEWKEICKLGKLEKLEELNIDDIQLESIEFPDVSPLEKSNLFLNLKALFVRRNNLKRWKDISELNKLKSLKKLMISHNPVIESLTPETSRQMIIAKVLGLETVNRTKIENCERRGAEIDYIKKYRNEWLQNGGSFVQNQLCMKFIEEHPTYLALLQRHGAADENEVKMQSSLLKDNLIIVQIVSPLVPEKLPVTKKLPTEMTVGKLKALVKRIFKVSSQDVILTRIFKEDENTKTVMNNDLRELSFYSVSNGDKIAVEW